MASGSPLEGGVDPRIVIVPAPVPLPLPLPDGFATHGNFAVTGTTFSIIRSQRGSSRLLFGHGLGRLLQNSARPDLGGDPDPGRLQIQTGRGKTRSGGVDIPVCPNAMTQQRLEHGLMTIGADRNAYPTGFFNSLPCPSPTCL